jgi:hypothetical protein
VVAHVACSWCVHIVGLGGAIRPSVGGLALNGKPLTLNSGCPINMTSSCLPYQAAHLGCVCCSLSHATNTGWLCFLTLDNAVNPFPDDLLRMPNYGGALVQ